jgi:hypothetical protein
MESGMSNPQADLYAMRQRYLDKIKAIGDNPNCLSELDQCVRQIEEINIALTRLAKQELIRHWPNEFDENSSI